MRESKNKTQLSHLILCRLQNLLPDDCGICNKRYSVKIEESPLLECSICGQGVHEECWSNLLSAASSASDPLIDQTDLIKKCLNPFNLPGVFYICPACEETTIPLEEENTKSKKKDNLPKKLPTPETVPPVDLNVDTSSLNENPIPTDDNFADSQEMLGLLDETKTDSQEVRSSDSTSPTEVETDHPADDPVDQKGSQQKSDIICRYFRRGTCKHGLRGNDCRYSHPQMCKKFMQHGTRQPNGCKLGKKCKQFHPLMCIDSLKKSECFNEQCTFNHIKGTRRQPKLIKNNQHSNSSPAASPNPPLRPAEEKPPENDNQADHFLEVVRLLKAEIITSMNNQISTLAAQIHDIKQTQAQRIPPQPMTQYYQPVIHPRNQFPMNLFPPQIIQGAQQAAPSRMQTPIQN